MPLPGVGNGTKRCIARSKRTGAPCQNPAVVKWGLPPTVCRMHGARKVTTIKRGSSHPQYRHGRETIEARVERARRLAELRDLEALSFEYGLVLDGTPRWRGRKPIRHRC